MSGGVPLASIEVLGQSVLQRAIMQLQPDGVSDILDAACLF